MSKLNEERFTDDQVKTALRRAIEIDAAGSLSTREDLYAVAAELGIAPETIDAALAEFSFAKRDSIDAARRARAATILAALGLPLGATAGSILATMPLFQAAGLLGLVAGAGFLISGGILILQGSAVTLRSFVLRNTALWGGFIAGSLAAIAVLGPPAAPELSWLLVVSQGVRRWLASTIVGAGAVVAIRNALRPTDDRDGAAPPHHAAERHGWWNRRAAAVQHWLGGSQRLELREQLVLRKLSAIRVEFRA